MTGSPPLRFLTLVLGGWVGVRAALIGSAWLQDVPAATAAAPAAQPSARLIPPPLPLVPAQVAVFSPETRARARVVAAVVAGEQHPQYSTLQLVLPAPVPLPAPGIMVAPPPEAQPLQSDPPLLVRLSKGASRWSASAWVFGRRGGAAGLAPGGTLGGSQAGARITYRLNGDPARPLAASFRAYAPLDSLRGAEASVGVDWKPSPKLPVHLLIERRQALGEEGRSAFAATAFGGVSDIGAGPLSIDAYGQAGVVGARSRDLFADGSARVSLPVAGAKIGAGIWGAAQPRMSRLDVGPQASVRLPGDLTLAVDWRLRVAGEAAPQSGPAVTLSAEF